MNRRRTTWPPGSFLRTMTLVAKVQKFFQANPSSAGKFLYTLVALPPTVHFWEYLLAFPVSRLGRQLLEPLRIVSKCLAQTEQQQLYEPSQKLADDQLADKQGTPLH